MAIPALSRDYIEAVACSIYADANAGMRSYFDPCLVPDVLHRLVDLSPRAIRLALQDAMARAATDGRRTLEPADIRAPSPQRAEQIGLLAATVMAKRPQPQHASKPKQTGVGAPMPVV